MMNVKIDSIESLTWRDKDSLLRSALQKAIRWGEVNSARYFAQEMIKDGKPGGVLNRLVVIAAEDVGFADPTLVEYVRQCYDEFETWEEAPEIKRSEAIDYPEACSIIDRGVIAAAIAFKSRLLPMISFATLHDIYKNENFDYSLEDYQSRFHEAIHEGDEKEALYSAYIIKEVFGGEEYVLSVIENNKQIRNTELIDEWIKLYTRKSKDRERLLLVGAILLLFRESNNEHAEYINMVDNYVDIPIEAAEIPDRAYDKHTTIGRRMGRGLEHFFNEGATVRNERFENDYEERGREAYFEAEEEGAGKTSRIVKAILEKQKKKEEEKQEFIIDLPFKYKKAVLTQARTHNDGIFTFIVEFHDGVRRFMKGPYVNREKAVKPLLCNEIKRRLASGYLHPIECEIVGYDTGFFLVCEELGIADLDEPEEVETKMDGVFKVIKYDSNSDCAPDPFKYINEINEETHNIWIQIMVNYCFRWIFGIGDAAKRNLMLERSTEKIYSTDEASIDSVDHKNIWNNRSPGKEVNNLVKEGSRNDYLLNMVLDEVSRWNLLVKDICSEFDLSSENIQRRIDSFLENPKKILMFGK